MADLNYNSSYTGEQVDKAVKQILDRGVTTIDSTTSLAADTIVLGDTGGRNIKSSTITNSVLSEAISRTDTFNSAGVTSADAEILEADKVVVGSGSHMVSTTDINKTDLANSITHSGNFNDYGLINGPKKGDSTKDLVTGNLVSYGGNNEMVDTGVSASTVSTMTIGVPQTGATGTGHLMLNEIPGISSNSKISITAALAGAGGADKFGTAVLYYGRNFYDVANIKHTENVTNEVGQRNVSYGITQDVTNLLYVAASNSAKENGFTSLTAASSYTDNVYNFNVKYNHQYLIVTQWTLAARDPETTTQVPFAPSAAGFYSGTTSLGSSTVTLTNESGATIASSTETIAYTGGVVYAYAFVRPTFTYSGTADTKSAWVYIQDATAITGDTLNGMFVIDITAPGDDAYNITASSSSSLVTSLENVYKKYLSSYNTFIEGSFIGRTKYCGPYYSTGMDYFRPYYRNWYVRVPSGLRIFIKEYKSSNGFVPSGYIKTISVGPGTNLAIALDQQVGLGEACLEFMVGKSDDSGLPATGTGTGQLAPNDASATASCAPLMQYVPAEFIGKTIDSSGSLFTWVRHYAAINMANGAAMTTNGISAADWASGEGGWSKTTYVSKTFDLSTITAGAEDSILIGTISFQTYGSGTKFAMGSLVTEINKTRISYAIDSVNGTILQVDQKVNNINNNSLFSTLPTAVGTYKYEVSTEGSPGSWSKEEETVHFFKTVWDTYAKQGIVDSEDAKYIRSTFLYRIYTEQDAKKWYRLVRSLYPILYVLSNGITAYANYPATCIIYWVKSTNVFYFVFQDAHEKNWKVSLSNYASTTGVMTYTIEQITNWQ